jgi:hypothetical protein
MFTIGEFSKITGLSVKTLRFDHEKGRRKRHRPEAPVTQSSPLTQSGASGEAALCQPGVVMTAIGSDAGPSRRVEPTLAPPPA